MTKRYLNENGIAFEEYDFKAEGKEAFAKFYRSNRNQVFRDADGVEFPVFTDGKQIRQGVSIILGYLIAGDGLAGYISRSTLHGEWIDGFHISTGDPAQAANLATVLKYLKTNGLKIEATCHGPNAEILKMILVRGLIDRLIMEVKGPADLYTRLTGQALDEKELSKSIALAVKFPECRIFTSISPLKRANGTVDFLTPEEIGETARLIEAATGSKKNAYTLKPFDPSTSSDEQIKGLEPLPSPMMFKHRTQARRYQVLTEIDK
jgi:pyruvate formate lyase activating enzyme